MTAGAKRKAAAKSGAGRPRLNDEAMKSHTVRTTDAQWGSSNASAGRNGCERKSTQRSNKLTACPFGGRFKMEVRQMKICMNDYGELVVEAENNVERLALREWMRRRENSAEAAQFVIYLGEGTPLPPRPAPSPSRKAY